MFICSRLAATATAKSLQSCPTLCNPIDGSPPGSAVPGILQARTLTIYEISRIGHSIKTDDRLVVASALEVEKEMAIHSSVLAWRIPGTGEPGGLLSMGSHRVGHD